ncbi:MAG: replication-associated recombination protein A [Kiritimatiellae bacterium]|jgi:putative ATPase|nr:replication-associated recombination protein A [Kiritimatiellia bacterium]
MAKDESNIFEKEVEKPFHAVPLAARMRPETLDEIAGQQHVVGEGKLLRRAIEADRISSIIFYGPPGCGKTSIAEVIAKVTSSRFERASGVTSNVSELRKIFEMAKGHMKLSGKKTILFVDEIHRFNKSQQDVMLPHLEDGTVILIGATTHNPNFFINSPLLSRSLVFELKALEKEDIISLLKRSLDDPRGLFEYNTEIKDVVFQYLAVTCNGDARKALNSLELAVITTPANDDGVIVIGEEEAKESIQKKTVLYDKNEDGHYDTISAFIKSVRGSDPHAAIYWLAKMIEAGEDPRFIARRLIILASEDIGNADPRALNVAVSAMQAVEFIGMPEARITLGQATAYLATAPKSNAAYAAIGAALDDVKSGRVLPVPEHLKNVKINAVTKTEEEKNATYDYPHSHNNNFVEEQEYVPTSARYYIPKESGYEATIKKRMEFWKKL